MHLASTIRWLAIAPLLWGCVSAPPAPVSPLPSVAVPFSNTSDTCDTALKVRVVLADAAIEVAPGETARLMAIEGVQEARIELLWPSGDPEVTSASWQVGAGAPARYFGCTAPEFLAPARGVWPVELVHHVHGCVPGPVGVAHLSVGGRLFARLPLGSQAQRYLPAGVHEVVVERAGARRAVSLSVGGGPARLELGCPEAEFRNARRLPLTVLSSEDACRAPNARVRVAGIEHALARQGGLTVFVPPGVHLVTWLVGARARTERVEVWKTGQVLSAAPCAATEG